jgi:Cu-Zn family superoxide dismutase
MRRLIQFFIAASVFFYACNNANREETTMADSTDIMNDTGLIINPNTLSSQMKDHAEAEIMATKSDTAVSGRLVFDTATDGKTKMNLEIVVPSRAGKSVAVHIHENGDCGNGGEMAHDHWNPTNEQHGKWGSGNYHSGDLGNVKLDKNGKGTLTITTDRWAIGGSADKNIIGKAVIVHSGTDDYKSQPTGNSGTRIGCGVIK